MLKHFHFWCQKVLPLVYDDSLSYYEVLCKVVKYINDLISQDQVFADQIQGLRADLAQVQQWIDAYDTTFAEKIIREHLATMIFVEISTTGYIIYNIPETWDDITFNTTGLDIAVPDYGYGHLVLSY